MEEPIIIGAKDHNTNTSLADMFKSKKHNVANKIDNREKCKSKIRQQKKPKTKEELFEIRKQMMKKRNRSTSPTPDGETENKNSAQKGNTSIDVNLDGFKAQPVKDKSSTKCKEPPPELLERLAGGTKVKVSLSENIIHRWMRKK